MFSEIIFVTQIRLHKDKKSLSVHFNDGFETQISAELLRVESPSAEVRGHSPDQKKIIRGKNGRGEKIFFDYFFFVQAFLSDVNLNYHYSIIISQPNFFCLFRKKEKQSLL